MPFQKRGRQRHPWSWTERPDPQLVMYEGRIAFQSRGGTRYRVYDRVVRAGKAETVSLGTRHARYRVFVNAQGERFRYVFVASDVRDPDPWTMEHQLARATPLVRNT